MFQNAKNSTPRRHLEELHPIARLAHLPPLVFTAECDLLRHRLAAVARGEAFLLHGGDGDRARGTDRHGARRGPTTADALRGQLRRLLQMAVVLTHATAMPVVKTGRLAGPYAASRPATAAPSRVLRMYESSAMSLNLLRALTAGGFADLRQVHAWNRGFVARSPAGARYEDLADEIERALSFMRACGVDTGALGTAEFFASHEPRLLGYESALTRIDPHTRAPYATSGHLLWLDERRHTLDDALLEHLCLTRNPVAVDLGPAATAATAATALTHLDRLDPRREPGRLTFVVRTGAERIRDVLPDLVEKVRAQGARVCWVCAPAHGGPATTGTALEEVRGFVEVHQALGTHPGGIHLDLTDDDSTACLDLAFLLAEVFRTA